MFHNIIGYYVRGLLVKLFKIIYVNSVLSVKMIRHYSSCLLKKYKVGPGRHKIKKKNEIWTLCVNKMFKTVERTQLAFELSKCFAKKLFLTTAFLKLKVHKLCPHKNYCRPKKAKPCTK